MADSVSAAEHTGNSGRNGAEGQPEGGRKSPIEVLTVGLAVDELENFLQVLSGLEGRPVYVLWGPDKRDRKPMGWSQALGRALACIRSIKQACHVPMRLCEVALVEAAADKAIERLDEQLRNGLGERELAVTPAAITPLVMTGQGDGRVEYRGDPATGRVSAVVRQSERPLGAIVDTQA